MAGSAIDTKSTDTSTTNNAMIDDTENRVKAYCPGHITGMFTVEDQDPNILKKGSRGVGFCTQLGAVSEAAFRPGTGILAIKINGKISASPITRRALGHMVPKLSLDIDINIELQAPIGQGFGMSSAGTMATCLAVASYLNLPAPDKQALKATHMAEVELGAGLGDAIAQATGGFVQRLAPGISSLDNTRKLKAPDTEILFCILGGELSTRSIIQHPEKKKIISQEGAKYLAEFGDRPNFDNFISLSGKFSKGTGLLTNEMSEVLLKASNISRGSMVMLGNTIFCIPDDPSDILHLEERLAQYGNVIRTRITETKPRIIPI